MKKILLLILIILISLNTNLLAINESMHVTKKFDSQGRYTRNVTMPQHQVLASSIEEVDAVLTALGVSTKIVNSIPDNMKENYIGVTEFKSTVLYKSPYIIAPKGELQNHILLEFSKDGTLYSIEIKEDLWMVQTLMILKDIKIKSDEYDIVFTCSWLRAPTWRYKDAISITSSNGLRIIPQTVSSYLQYDKLILTDALISKQTTHTIKSKYNDDNQIITLDNGIAFTYNLPSDIIATSSSTTYSDFFAYISYRVKLTKATQALNFGITGAYAHSMARFFTSPMLPHNASAIHSRMFLIIKSAIENRELSISTAYSP